MLETFGLYRPELTEEERSEITRFNTQEMYRKVGFKRWYFMIAFGFVSISGYTMYVTNKRKALINSVAVDKVKQIILGHKEINSMMRNKIFWVDIPLFL